MGIFKRLFRRKAKTFILDQEELSKRKFSNISQERNIDKSIFQIIHTLTMNEHGTLISGRIKRGFFKTGDKIVICNPSDNDIKLEATIVNIKTSLVDVNRICSGSEADLLITTADNEKEITPGNIVYKN